MRAFITGVTGQDGTYLARLLLEKGYEVHGGAPRIAAADCGNLAAFGIADEVRLHRFDLGDEDGIAEVLAKVRADEVYNLAASSSVGASWDDPAGTVRTNALAVAAMLRALRDTGARFCQASTAEMFGRAGGPMSEEAPLRPVSPYGAAKTLAHHLVASYREGFGLHASSAILFNHESPLRPSDFVTRKITMGLARLARGGTKPVTLGNLEARRDWGFAGDYVYAMRRMLQRSEAGDFVVATGVATSIREFVDLAAGALGMELEWEGEGTATTARLRLDGSPAIEVSEAFYRPVDVPIQVGDARKAARELDWRPAVAVADLAAMMARADYDALA